MSASISYLLLWRVFTCIESENADGDVCLQDARPHERLVCEDDQDAGIYLERRRDAAFPETWLWAVC